MPTTTTEVPCEAAYKHLLQLLNTEKDRTVHQRIQAHLRAVTGLNQPIPLFHANKHVAEDAKLDVYKTLIRALATRNFAELRGQLGVGDKRVDPIEAVEKEATPTSPPSPQSADEGVATEEPAVKPRFEMPETGGDDELSVLAHILLKRISPFLPKGEAVDAEAVKRISKEVFDHTIHNGGFPVDRVKQLIDEHLQGNAVRVEVVKPDGSVQPISGLCHEKLPLVLSMVQARTLAGYSVPVWMDGPPGGGKTHIMEQIAEGLGVPHYVLAISPTDTKSVIVGYRNLATGEYVPGLAYEAYKNGGLVGIDECTNGDPGILVSINSLIANRTYRFPNGELVTKHQDCFFIVGDNTRGTGSTGGFIRNKLDAATLDRFAMVRVDYDHKLEVTLCGNAKWADYVLKVRQFIDSQGKTGTYITPRAAINGAALLRAGIDCEQVCDAVLFKLVSADTKATLLANCGAYQP